ncbi:hypothetical protein AYK20_00930 [Thermoplasmatales archaeon SG8-52-1]|nr:MAG: hypothetical protein AYK20_00930 [Thermoplasmatales archaeon SG8-52-1]
MSRYGSSFREPPWVIGSPKEVMDWMESSHPSKKKKDAHKIEKKFLKNLHIKFDFNVKTREIKPVNFISKIIHGKMIEEDFDLLATAELILRGLAKAKFKNTAKIVIDGKTVYEHPEKKSDLRKTIEDISEFSSEIAMGKNLEITAILADVEKAIATIKINKVHKLKEHSIDIKINGKIREEIYHIFLNYLNEKIGLKEP